MAIARPSTHGERLARGNFYRIDLVENQQDKPYRNKYTLENSFRNNNSLEFENFPVTYKLKLMFLFQC